VRVCGGKTKIGRLKLVPWTRAVARLRPSSARYFPAQQLSTCLGIRSRAVICDCQRVRHGFAVMTVSRALLCGATKHLTVYVASGNQVKVKAVKMALTEACPHLALDVHGATNHMVLMSLYTGTLARNAEHAAARVRWDDPGSEGRVLYCCQTVLLRASTLAWVATACDPHSGWCSWSAVTTVAVCRHTDKLRGPRSAVGRH
jgi:hypothetical protein